jgi:hypothetical protein
LVWESACQVNLAKRDSAAAASLETLAALDAFSLNAAAMSIAEEEAAGFRKQRRVGGISDTAAQQ